MSLGVSSKFLGCHSCRVPCTKYKRALSRAIISQGGNKRNKRTKATDKYKGDTDGYRINTETSSGRTTTNNGRCTNLTTLYTAVLPSDYNAPPPFQHYESTQIQSFPYLEIPRDTMRYGQYCHRPGSLASIVSSTSQVIKYSPLSSIGNLLASILSFF